MLKRTLATLMAIMMVVGLAACGNEEETGSTQAAVEESQATESNEAAVETTTEAAEVVEELVYPTEDLFIMVPMGVGGNGDIKARMITQQIAKNVDSNFVVVNKPGAGGAVGAMEYLSSPHSDHSFLFSTIGMFTITQLYNPDAAFSLEDFKPVVGVVKDPFVLYVNPEVSGINSFEELVAYAQDNTVTFGSSGPTATNHLLQSALYKMAGFDSKAVTGKNGFENVTNLLGGHVDIVCANPGTAMEQVKDGNLVPIACYSEEAYLGFEGFEVPTLQSFDHDVVFESLNFIMAKKETPDEVIDAMYDIVIEAYNSPEFIEQATTSGFVPDRSTPAELLASLEQKRDTINTLFELVNQ